MSIFEFSEFDEKDPLEQVSMINTGIDSLQLKSGFEPTRLVIRTSN
jgi:hypothetical protein